MAEDLEMKPSLRTLTGICVLAGIYFCAGKFGLSWAYLHPSATAVWPPTGIALAALLLWGWRLWPAIFLGAFLVNITNQGSLLTTLGIAAGNTLEALLAAWGINRFANGARAFERARNAFKFILIAAILSTVVSATVGVTSLTLGGFAQWTEFAAIWLTWWLGDAVGDLIVAPFLLIWMTQPFPRLKVTRVLEAAGLLLSIILIAYLMFLIGVPSSPEYITVLPLLWAAFRFGQRGAVTSALIMSGIALAGTLYGVGPFAHANSDESLLYLQSFMGTMAIAALVLASVISEGKRAEQRLQVQDAISRILAESPALKEAAALIIQVLCERAGWDWGAIWNVDRETNELCCVEVWHMPFTQVPRFEAETIQRRFPPGTGLPGRVWSTGKPAWISDVTTDSNFPRAPVATKEGLHGAFGFPIKLGDETLGVIECISHEVREPDDHFLQMVSDIGGQIGQFMERKRAEDDLRAQRSQLRAVTDVTPVLLTQCSRDLRYTFVNQAYAAMLNLTPDQIIGRPIPQIMGAEAFAAIRPHVETVLQGKPVEFELEIPFQQVGPRFLRMAYLPDKDAHGQVRGWIGSISDITERKRAESEIAALNQQLAADLAAMTRLQQLSTQLVQTHDAGSLMNDILDVAIDITNADMGNVQLIAPGSGALKIVAQRGFEGPFLEFFDTVHDDLGGCETAMQRGYRVIVEDVAISSVYAGTPACEIMLAAGARAVQSTPLVTRSGQLIGMLSTHYRKPHHPSERQLTGIDLLARQAADFVERSRTEELLVRNEERLRTANEELERRVQERTADLEQANAALIKTIDEQKSLEEQLRQAQKMEIIGTLAGGIAHDFNNILNIIWGYATLINQQSAADPQIGESVKVIDEQIKRGATVVRQLLTVARKTETHLAPTDANDLVLTFSELIKQAFPKTITVVIDLEPKLPAVLADVNQMSQSLLNICVNARDAMPRGGKLTIRTELIDEEKMRARLKAETSACVCIVISDSGLGMEEGVRARIFEPFYTTKGIGEGTGLGLAIVYGIVKEHNGFVEVESAPGKGTTFRLYLPIFQSKERLAVDDIATGEASGREQAKPRGTVLVVEDDEAMIYLLKKLLPQAGYQMFAATDGAAAIDLYFEHKEEIDVVLLDLGLPKVAGLDVIHKLKEHNPAVKIIVATGYLEPELKSEIFRAGVNDCINKPYLVNDVLDKLGYLIESSQT